MLLYPNSLDTLLAMRRLYDRLPQYDLKSLAKEFNFIIKNRVYFTSEDFNNTTKNMFDNKELWNNNLGKINAYFKNTQETWD